jgi:hypothetical protein
MFSFQPFSHKAGQGHIVFSDKNAHGIPLMSFKMNPFLNRVSGFTRKSSRTNCAEFKNGTLAYLDASAQNTHRRIALPEDNEATG